MTWRTGTSAYQSLPLAMDPLADWIRPEVVRSPTGRTLLLVRLAEGVDIAALRSFRHAPDPNRLFVHQGRGVTTGQWHQTLDIPATASGTWSKARYLTARALPLFFEWLLASSSVQSLFDEITLCQSIDAPPAPLRLRSAALAAPMAKPRDVRVLTGIIDHGFPVAGPVFSRRSAGQGGWGTRLRALWIQDGRPAAAHPDQGLASPEGFEYGAKISGEGIVRHLASVDGDEDRFYAATGLFRSHDRDSYWTQLSASHGAHVSGLALDPSGPVDGSEPVVAVHLPKTTVDDSSGAALSAHAFDALRFILAEAEHIAHPAPAPLFVLDEGQPRPQPEAIAVPPVVVNLSYGFNAGPHDGEGPLEKALLEMQTLWSRAHPRSPLVIVLPAGNGYQSQTFAQWDRHALSDPAKARVIWEIPPDDGSANSVQIWLPRGFRGKAHITLTSPSGASMRLGNRKGTIADLQGRSGVPVAMGLYCAPQASRPRGMFQLVVGPTQPDAVNRSASGAWEIRIEATGLLRNEAIEAWVQRDDLPVATARPSRQSRFRHADFRPFDPPGQPGDGSRETSPVQRPGSLNALATGPRTLVIGACAARKIFPIEVSLYSGGGRPEWQNGVDGLAASDDSALLPGRLSSGMRAAGSIRLFGTSMAAAMATREIARLIHRFRRGKPKTVFAQMLVDPPVPVPDARRGNGRLAP
ncbi:hypothetical protein [Rhabdaerophilum sp. SD176]|uniref:hypothetical protein n=1 Tax=Rhabdaerophilum sp. SD176 TaxID=2983548 RepID=UPI0024DF5D26|nr:hypothetical protein [Rhabdaerophilum sp. SD176]